MPFLRRRGIMASESDMRRHSVLDSLDVPKPPLSRSESASDLAALASVAEDLPAPTSSAPVLPARPPSAPRESMSSITSNTPSSTSTTADRFASLPTRGDAQKHRRFSMLRFRNASDSQLAAKAKLHAANEKAPPLPRPPAIITTAPTLDLNAPPKKQPSRMKLSMRIRKSSDLPRIEQEDEPGGSEWGGLEVKRDRRKTQKPGQPPPLPDMARKQSVTFDEPKRPQSSSASTPPPPAYGDDASSTLALPVNRLSESSRSDASSGDRVYGTTTTTTHTVQTTTTFFRLRRKPKQPEPLFPIAHLAPKSKSSFAQESDVSSSSLAARTPESRNGSPSRSQSGRSVRSAAQMTPTPSRPTSRNGVMTPPTPAATLFSKSNASPATALFRPSSRNSGQSSPTRAHLHMRGRSSTLSSLGRNSPRPSVDEHLAVPATRTSSSTGRKSFGDLLGLSRLRQNQETASGHQGSLTPATPGSIASKNNSLQLPRDSIILPERRDDDTPVKYLERLLEVVSRSVIAAAVSKGTDAFSQSVLRSYMRSFRFFEDPMDMAIRKLLMEAELPKETQQIDRCLQAFANRYHECNPGIYSSPDQAYFIAFSLLILHTDVFNKNNKHKMQKADYLKNTRGEGLYDEILEVFYDNITYTPFIHVEDDLDINGERIITHKTKRKSIFPGAAPDPAKRVAKEPLDPYTLIIDNRLDILRPNLKEVMHLDDHYSYLGTAKSLNLKELQKTFFKTGILQIVSARSRPDAFMSEKTATNPEEAPQGIVDIKITKVGLLWRKDAKKKKTRSPWQEWGAILTGAQLYFFRNTAWVKNLIHQYEDHVKKGHEGDPCIFKPPLDQFKPDALMSTDGAVALMDSTYKKHKHAFVYVRHGGFEEVLLAEDEDEMNDWLAKLNYAAAFRTSGVRMRGVVGGNLDGQVRRAIRRLDTDSSQSIQTPTGEVTVSRSRIDHKMAQDILAARRDIMLQKVANANEKLEVAEKSLESQLRNSRHLQILAPIHPKTREQMLLSAARMAAQLKWTRMEIWRLKCHRDILLMDLEEERQLLGLPQEAVSDGPAPAEKAVANEETKTAAGNSPIRSPTSLSPLSPIPFSLTRTSTVTGRSDEDSSQPDVFQTPPTSATAPTFHRHQNSWELPALKLDHGDHRKASVSSVVSSSNRSITATPPRNIGSSSTKSTIAPDKFDQSEDEVDANERDLLEQAGLIDSADQKAPSLATDAATEDGSEQRERPLVNGTPSAADRDRNDRNKIRRSLQRTLREGAGHISHHRSRKGKEPASSGGGGINGSDDTTRDGGNADILVRGTGSFVVHGKKASVITFGSELQLQTLSSEERFRRKGQRGDAAADTGAAISPSGSNHHLSVENGINGGGTPAIADFRSILTARSASSADGRDADGIRVHRDSAASASTATARSFRELHRKYSSATQAAKVIAAAAATSGGGSLALPYDEDSDAAISFSDGRRTPLPPIEGEAEEEAELITQIKLDTTSERLREGAKVTEDGFVDSPVDVVDLPASSSRDNINRQTAFFTPQELPASPVEEQQQYPSERAQGKRPEEEEKPGGRLPSPPLQVVSA